LKKKTITPVIAFVDVQKVKYQKGPRLGIDYFNEIDIWAQMEFTFRRQVQQLKTNKTTLAEEKISPGIPIIYSLREKID
jgi:hypothetical protein